MRISMNRRSVLKGVKAVLAGAVVTGSSFFYSDMAQAETYKLRFSDIGPPRGVRAETMMWWADEIKERTNGQVEIEFFWSQSLVKGKDTLKAVGSGLVDMGTVLGIYTPADLPIWNLANAPFGGRDPWVGMKTWQELRKVSPDLRAETDKKNVKILVNTSTGSVDILSNKPILKAEDLNGLKIRATGGWGGLLQRLGATPVSIGYGELYQALDKGTVDGTINYIQEIAAYKHYEVAGHITEVQMGQVLGLGLGINLETFNSMPEEVQNTILEVSDEFLEKFTIAYNKGVDEAREAMKAGIDGNKVEFHYLEDDERERWRAEADFFIQDWIEDMDKKGFDGRELVATMQELRAKYETELAEQGYPWER